MPKKRLSLKFLLIRYILYAPLTTYILAVPATSYNNLPTQLSLNMFTVKEVSEQHLVSDQRLENKNRINTFYYSEFPNCICFGRQTSVLSTQKKFISLNMTFDIDLYNPIKQ